MPQPPPPAMQQRPLQPLQPLQPLGGPPVPGCLPAPLSGPAPAPANPSPASAAIEQAMAKARDMAARLSAAPVTNGAAS